MTTQDIVTGAIVLGLTMESVKVIHEVLIAPRLRRWSERFDEAAKKRVDESVLLGPLVKGK